MCKEICVFCDFYVKHDCESISDGICQKRNKEVYFDDKACGDFMHTMEFISKGRKEK